MFLKMFGVVYMRCCMLYDTQTCIFQKNIHFLPGNRINLLVFSFNLLDECN
eukprot:UN01065